MEVTLVLPKQGRNTVIATVTTIYMQLVGVDGSHIKQNRAATIHCGAIATHCDLGSSFVGSRKCRSDRRKHAKYPCLLLANGPNRSFQFQGDGRLICWRSPWSWSTRRAAPTLCNLAMFPAIWFSSMTGPGPPCQCYASWFADELIHESYHALC